MKMLLALVSVLALSGCAREPTDRSAVRRDTRDVTDVVARVGGQPIGAAEIAARMAAEDLDAGRALDQLVADELLMQEAMRRGLTASAEQRRAVERLMVRAMLRDFEAELTPQSVPDDEVRADFAAHREALQVPERRASWHILVEDTTEAGRARAESILSEVRAARDPRTVYDRYAQPDTTQDGLRIVTEELPLMSQKAAIEKPYKDALFEAESKGPLKELVETSHGWHVIVLTRIVPGQTRTLDDVEEEIRERLSQKKRFEKLAGTVRALEARGLVEYDARGVERLLSMSGLPERAE